MTFSIHIREHEIRKLLASKWTQRAITWIYAWGNNDANLTSKQVVLRIETVSKGYITYYKSKGCIKDKAIIMSYNCKLDYFSHINEKKLSKSKIFWKTIKLFLLDKLTLNHKMTL